MTRTSRRVGLGALAVAAALGLSACQYTTQASDAAIVGDDTIGNSTLGNLLDRGLANEQARARFATSNETEQQFQLDLLSTLINRELYAEAARAHGIRVSTGAVDRRLAQLVDQAGGEQALRQQVAAGGIAAEDLRGFVRDLVVQDALGAALTADVPVDPQTLKSLYDANRAQFEQAHIEAIVVKDNATAQQIAAAVGRDPSRFAELAKKFSTDPSAAQGGDVGTVGFGQLPDALNTAVFTATPGSTFVVHTAPTFSVVHVVDRSTTTLAQALPQLRRQALGDEYTKALDGALERTARRIGVHVNPRFGRYDVAKHSVVPRVKDVLSPAPSEAAASGR